ncbi:MAG: hypothetical protein ACLFV5_09640 [Anaerolineales bacterium]
MFKLIMTWNIKEGKEKDYLDFLTHDFTKSVMGMGIQPTDAWYAVWGRGPQVLAGGVTEELETMEKALASDEWRALLAELQDLVVDFNYKVVEAEGGFQL